MAADATAAGRGAPAAAAPASRLPAAPAAARPRRRGALVPADVHRGRRPGRLPVAARSGRSSYVAQEPEQITQADAPLLPADPATFTTRARSYDVYYVPDRRHDAGSWRCVKPGRTAEHSSSTRRTRTPRRSPGRARGGRSTRPGRSRPQWENYADGLEPDRLPAAAVQHGRDRADRDDRDGRCRARSSPTASPGSGSRAGTCCSRSLIATIFLPGAVTIIPTYTIFVEARLGRHVAAAARARRSSPTPTTCSCCASTS